MQGLLPSFDAGNPYEATVHTLSTNPCLPFSDLIGELTRWVPKDRPAGIEKFIAGVTGTVGRVAELASTAQCLYEADRLAIKVYQHKDYPWSIGIVAVVRGDFEAVGTAAECWLLGRPLNAPTPTRGSGCDPLAPRRLLSRLRRPSRNGERFTVI